MENKVQTYKSDSRKTRLPSCSTDLTYFGILYDVLEDISEEAIKYQTTSLKSEDFNSVEEFENAKTEMKDLLKISVQIRGTNGEFLLSKEKSVFDESGLPNSITDIKFDNFYLFKYVTNSEPLNSFLVEFDFSKPSIFDFTLNPSAETMNRSGINVIGQNSTWVQGAYKRIVNTLDGLSTKRSWLHKNNIYDIFLWLLVLPIAFLNLYKFELHFYKDIVNIHTIFVVALHLYFFVLILILYMLFFKYTRWLFPYIEFRDSLRNKAALHRSVWFILLIGVIGNIITLLLI